ncbi:TonB family protein [Halomonas sp. ANAO-440]|uniref:energy transducer TonB n=1 Tax=Halomonas sp. ANAO-440 TaxID=2861360 RepID=UPI001CAA5261|nr:energy transducer TonB [Halomonas sp. ANAO-440]MBZ0331264.1 TonB family protein [Halomonas sp. ANAO-440]
MIRISFSLLGGVALALLLFWLLALLVTPPEEEFEVLDAAMTMNMVEAPDTVQEEPVEPVEPSVEPPPPQVEVSPPPQPESLPPRESAIAMPEPELPPEPMEPLEVDSSLPELAEIQPEPSPERAAEPPPEPAPEPPPEPAPESPPQPESIAEPVPEPSPRAESSPSPPQPSAAPTPGPTPEQAAPAEQGPVDVGQIAPTSRVPPEYPSRAQRRGLEGHVELEFLIRPDGSIDRASIRVIESQPRNVFDSAAEQAVGRWQFEPASGVRRARQRLEFQLR